MLKIYIREIIKKLMGRVIKKWIRPQLFMDNGFWIKNHKYHKYYIYTYRVIHN